MQLNVRRITYYDIKSTFFEDLRELFLPVEGFVACDGGVADERVAALDVFAEGVELAARLGCPQPQGKLRYLYALFVDVHSIEIVLQYLVVDLV